MPGDLDFITQGFHMGDAPVSRQAQAPPPTYDAPPSPHAGFTRSPKEDDVLVCPNCEDELGLGEDDVKRQVWAVKACGHVRLFSLSHENWVAADKYRFTAVSVPSIGLPVRKGKQLE